MGDIAQGDNVVAFPQRSYPKFQARGWNLSLVPLSPRAQRMLDLTLTVLVNEGSINEQTLTSQGRAALDRARNYARNY